MTSAPGSPSSTRRRSTPWPPGSATRVFASSSRTNSASAASSASTPRPDGCGAPAPPELLIAIDEFNDGRFFEQHETLELLWRAETSAVRDLYHGILQIGVGCHHWRAGNRHGARTLLGKGIDHLAPCAPACQGVDVAALVRDARALLERLDQQEQVPFDLNDAPRVHLIAVG
ncbi:MAG: DUF309 domain-containing protein [Chloroflexi bacterium]|nr:DUF309 domain-containing protein [Chloroflexota bacterium]